MDVSEFTRSDLAPVDLTDDVMRGSYAYLGADCLPYMIDWFADGDGFYLSNPHEAPSIQSLIIEVDLNKSADFGDKVELYREDIINDESAFDEVFSISGNDLPAYVDEVSQLLGSDM